MDKRSDDRRAIIIVLDSVGIGELPDAADYGDTGSNTVGNIAKELGGLRLPHLQSLGLGNILTVQGVAPVAAAAGAYGRMSEASPGKDTTTGHWELAGIVLERPFPVYPGGFPPAIVEAFVSRIGRPILGNKVASGTEIIAELGEEHVKTGHPIIYTSADSVFQVAAHEEVISVEELYRICGIARELLAGEHAVGRVIARPFTGRPGAFRRTGHRKDFSLAPPEGMLLDVVASAGLPAFGIGKIEDIFAGRGLTGSNHTTTNGASLEATLEWMREAARGLCFVNLVDFDMVYGHRNDVAGYAKALEEFDAFLPRLLGALRPTDLFIVTADHGCDPTTPSTDHSREFVPLFVLGGAVKAGVNLGTRTTLADVGATVAEWLGAAPLRAGKSFMFDVIRAGV